MSKSETVSDLRMLDLSALYVLAQPSTPAPLRHALVSRAAAGEKITRDDVVREREKVAIRITARPSTEQRQQKVIIITDRSSDSPHIRYNLPTGPLLTGTELAAAQHRTEIAMAKQWVFNWPFEKLAKHVVAADKGVARLFGRADRRDPCPDQREAALIAAAALADASGRRGEAGMAGSGWPRGRILPRSYSVKLRHAHYLRPIRHLLIQRRGYFVGPDQDFVLASPVEKLRDRIVGVVKI
jgi:hypothetical protein